MEVQDKSFNLGEYDCDCDDTRAFWCKKENYEILLALIVAPFAGILSNIKPKRPSVAKRPLSKHKGPIL